MHITIKDYSDEFRLECKREFGLEPEQIKKIVASLAANSCLNVDEHLREVDDLKKALVNSCAVIQSLTVF